MTPPPPRGQPEGQQEWPGVWGGPAHDPAHACKPEGPRRRAGCLERSAPNPPPTRAQPGGALGLGGAAVGHVAPQECAGVRVERGRGRAGTESNGLLELSDVASQGVGVELPPCGRGRGTSPGG